MNTRVAHKKKWWGGRPPGYQLLTQGTSEVTLNVRQFKHLIQAINEKIRYIKLIFNILQKDSGLAMVYPRPSSASWEGES